MPHVGQANGDTIIQVADGDSFSLPRLFVFL